MATEVGFLESPYQQPDFKSATTSTMRGSAVANKRKRDLLDHETPEIQGPPSNIRTSSQYRMQNEANAPAPTANMNDPTDTSFMTSHSTAGNDDNAQHFDLSALQAHAGHDGSNLHQTATGGHDPSSSTLDTAAAALSQAYTMHVPEHPSVGFMNQPTEGEAYGLAKGHHQDFQGLADDGQDQSPGEQDSAGPGGPKPSVGSDEWHKVRKDNHKEVERRRRETINEGINELAKIVPGCEKNKGSILARAVQYIQKLHDDATSNIDKWTFEKLVTEQAIADLSQKLGRCYEEREGWKRIAADAGVDVDSVIREGRLGGQEDGDDEGVQGEESAEVGVEVERLGDEKTQGQ